VQPDPPFTLVSTVPADRASAIPRNTSFSATFSDTVAPASVGAGSAKLIGPESNALPATVRVSGSAITLSTPVSLPGNTTYYVQLDGAIANTKGETLGNTVTRYFTTAPQSWQAPVAIGSLQYLLGNTAPSVQADPAGNVVAVWRHSPSRIDTITTSRMDAGSGAWSAPVNLAVSADINGALSDPQMAVAAKGDVYVTWTAYASGTQTSQIVHYDPASGAWNALPALAGTGARLVTDAAGNLMALISNGGVGIVSFNAASNTWGTPVRLDLPAVPASYLLDLNAVADGKGNLLVGWVQDTPDGRALYVTQNSSGRWSTPQRLDTSVQTGLFRCLSLAVNANGSAAVSWAHDNGIAGNPTVMASTFAGGSAGWSTAVRLDQTSPVFGAQRPWTVVDTAGVATTIWSEYEGLFASRYSPATGAWSAPQRIHDNGSTALAVVDAAGNITVAQQQSTGTQLATQYLVGENQWHDSAFGPSAPGSNDYVNPPVLTIDASGTVTAAWFAAAAVNGVQQYSVAASQFR
jgi:hypothetical protein